MWILFIKKDNEKITEYIKINESFHIVFDNDCVKFYSNKGMVSFFKYDEYYIDTTLCDDVYIEKVGEEKVFVEILQQLTNKFKEKI